METETAARPPAIPFEHREAMRWIDRALGQELCKTVTLAVWRRAAGFAETCFYYLDQLGDEPIHPVGFCKYLHENGHVGESRWILSKIIREIQPSSADAVQHEALEFLCQIS